MHHAGSSPSIPAVVALLLAVGVAGCGDASVKAQKAAACIPATCTSLRKDCGTVSDGCGSPLECGNCSLPATCGGGGTTNVCAAPGGVSRPSHNTGTGFFVANGKLYDANGIEFRIRGVNKSHYDFAWPGVAKTHANTIRWSTPLWLGGGLVAGLMQDTIDQRMIPMPAVWYVDGSYSDASNVTCKSSTGVFNTAVDQWVALATTMKPFERYLLLNIANEWGPDNSTVWRDAYINAVSRLRAAGYLSTIVIDSGGCGQNPDDLVNFAQAVFQSDPQRNIVFDIHIYGGWANGNAASWQTDLSTAFDQFAALGVPMVVGEFGPGRNIGPSPTLMTPGEIILAAEARGFGWLAWAWDDGNDDSWFAMSTNGDYRSAADLTIFGRDVVENTTYGLLYTAQAATVFP